MKKQISLESVTAAFDEWRKHRSSPRGRIPVALQTHAVELLQSHPVSRVLKALKINHAMLKRWQQPHRVTNECEFVRLTPTVQPTLPQPALHVALRNADGGELTIIGLTLPQITTLALSFSASSEGSR